MSSHYEKYRRETRAFDITALNRSCKWWSHPNDPVMHRSYQGERDGTECGKYGGPRNWSEKIWGVDRNHMTQERDMTGFCAHRNERTTND